MIEYREYEGELSDDVILKIAGLAMIADNNHQLSIKLYRSNFLVGLAGRPWIHVALAYDGEELVGYKLGRSDDPRSFESWRGAVHPDYRRRGIAMKLADIQEDWCTKNKFAAIMTRTEPDNKAMLILNIKRDFHVTGTVLIRGQHMNVILYKSLS